MENYGIRNGLHLSHHFKIYSHIVKSVSIPVYEFISVIADKLAGFLRAFGGFAVVYLFFAEYYLFVGVHIDKYKSYHMLNGLRLHGYDKILLNFKFVDIQLVIAIIPIPAGYSFGSHIAGRAGKSASVSYRHHFDYIALIVFECNLIHSQIFGISGHYFHGFIDRRERYGVVIGINPAVSFHSFYNRVRWRCNALPFNGDLSRYFIVVFVLKNYGNKLGVVIEKINRKANRLAVIHKGDTMLSACL